MQIVKTANTPRHSYSKNLKKYIVTKSTRSVKAILRASRFDAGFFFLEYYPLVRDMWLRQHKNYTNKDFEVFLQLHGRQQFNVDDIMDCTITKKNPLDDNWKKKTSYCFRTVQELTSQWQSDGMIRVFKNHSKYNKAIYEFTPKESANFKRLYEYMLCISKIPTMDTSCVDPVLRKSVAHYKKMIKQNAMREAMEGELDREMKTHDKEYRFSLRQLRGQKH